MGQGGPQPLGLGAVGGITGKCQHNVMSRVRRSNVQTVLSGEQLIDQVQSGLLCFQR